MIKFEEFLNVKFPKNTKVKFNIDTNKKDKDNYALAWDLLREDSDRWLEMNEWKDVKSASNRLDSVDYLLAFARYYPYGDEYYIFGGFYKVVSRDENIKQGRGYKLELLDDFKEYRKRLIVKFDKAIGQTYNLYYENVLDKMPIVYEIAPDIKAGEFTGYSNVCLTHKEMQAIYNGNAIKWKLALSRVKCVYCITDTATGQLYIGSASEDNEGIWGRWKKYADVKDLTGGNKAFEEMKKDGAGRIIDKFTYSILEIFDMRTDRKFIQNREEFWKKVFRSVEHGMNRVRDDKK